MVRVCFLMWLLLILLSACAAEQAQAPAAAQPLLNDAAKQANDPAKKESVLDCAREQSLMGAWACASKN